MRLPSRPTIYEINTAVWLGDLSRTAAHPVDLSSVPAAEWDALAALHVDAVWLMGVWQRSPAGLAIARQNPELVSSFRATLPDLRDEDVIGSPYCVRAYEVDSRFGGPAALAKAREELAKRGIGLILDYVPNHVAPDHPWTTEHPDYFIRGTEAELEAEPEAFIQYRRWSARERQGPVLRSLAGRRSAECVLARVADGGDRDPGLDRRSVRRCPLRHGDVDDQRGIRAYVG